MADEQPETEGGRSDADEHSVTPEELSDRIRRGEPVHLLDLRDREEFEAWRIEGERVDASQLSYAEFAAAKARDEVADLAADLDLDEPVIAVCPRGEVSATAARLLREAGVDARNLAGGMEAWARVYVARELPASATGADEATVLQYDRPASGCFAYLVVSGDEAAVIDPLRAFADRYPDDAAERGADLTHAIDTHVHADHLSGVRTVACETDAEPVVPAGAEDRGLAFDARMLADGDELDVGDVTLRAHRAPGHTSELTVFRLADALFSGDALFVDSFGRPDLETGGSGARDLAETVYDTLTDDLFGLPDETLVAPGHRRPDANPNSELNDAYAARLVTVRERLGLPDDREAFVERVLDSLPPRPANYEAIVPANLGRESIDDAAAFEIELGPNNCAVGDD
ncbi:MBL fold metallo-hydrolase [Halobacteriales archaeon QS_1_67_19]|nr:MAG: MBL fold metallo-hydrolase [Halobacteriales archaeon QS_1_67_19]